MSFEDFLRENREYIRARYGSDEAARAEWTDYGWYDNGGHIPGGSVPMPALDTGFIITRAQLEALGPSALLDELNRRDEEEDAD